MLSHATYVGNKRKKTEDRIFLPYPILCPLCRLHQRNKIKTKFTQLRIYFNLAFQVHIVGEKGFYKMWTFDCSILQYRGEVFYQTMHCSNKKVIRALRHELVEWITKILNVRESL